MLYGIVSSEDTNFEIIKFLFLRKRLRFLMVFKNRDWKKILLIKMNNN